MTRLYHEAGLNNKCPVSNIKMDLTNLFKACVKTIHIRNKSISDKNRILKVKTRDEFLLRANDIKYQISQLRDLIVDNRAAYLRFGFHLKTARQMTNEERDVMDLESDKIIVICNQYINDLSDNFLKDSSHYKEQFVHHKLLLLNILSDYLRKVYQMHCEQKKYRIQHEVYTLKLLKLETKKKNFSNWGNSHSNEKIFLKYIFNEDGKKSEITHQNSSIRSKSIIYQTLEDDQIENRAVDEKSNEEDIQLLEKENIIMLNEMNNITEEVGQIEKNVGDIAQLQDIFTEKVGMIKIYFPNTTNSFIYFR